MALGHSPLREVTSTPRLFEVPPAEATSVAPRDLGTRMSRVTRRRLVAMGLVFADSVGLLAAGLIATFALGRLAPSEVAAVPGYSYATPTFLLTLITVASMHSAGLYRLERLGWGTGEYQRVGRSIAVGVAGLVFLIFLLDLSGASRLWIAFVGTCATGTVGFGRAVLRLVRSRIQRNESWLQRPTLIVGSNLEAAEVVRLLDADRHSALHPIGSLRSSLKDTLSFDYCAPSLPSLGTARDLKRIVSEQSVDTVIIVASAFDYPVIQRMIKELRDMSVTIHLSSALSEVLSSRVLMQEVGGIPLISLKGVSLSSGRLREKRVFDVLGASLILLAIMPLFLVLAALIKLTSRGPLFYKQDRIGRDGKPFKMYKFRSMVADADRQLEALRSANEADGPLFKIRDDPRITPVGRWIRKFSLDEFPQLINVLRGEMSLVGPRPPLPGETAQYSSRDWRRLEVVPGMTGLWQVSGRCELTFSDMVRLDVFYIDNWSIGLDLSLLLRTPATVLSARGAC